MKLDPTGNRNASLVKASRLLLAFSEETPELGVMELAKKLDLNKSTASRFVSTLTQLGLLERTEKGRKVRLSLRLFELGMRAARHRPLVREAQPIIARLAEQVRDRVFLATLIDDAVVLLLEAGVAQRKPALEVGRPYPATRGALGRVLRNGNGDHPHEEGNGNGVAADLAVASDQGELIPGLSCVAASVLDRSGQVVAAVALAGSSNQVSRTTMSTYATMVRRSAAELSSRLGFFRAPEPISNGDRLDRSSRTA